MKEVVIVIGIWIFANAIVSGSSTFGGWLQSIDTVNREAINQANRDRFEALANDR